MPRSTSQSNILCISDDGPLLHFLRTLLERSGYPVVTARSAEQGLQLVTIYRIDLVLLDNDIPWIDASEVTFLMKSWNPALRVIMISGKERPVRALAMVDAFVSKLETSQQLLPVIFNLCNDIPGPMWN
jgi:DNA-binding NtrC family response regulator